MKVSGPQRMVLEVIRDQGPCWASSIGIEIYGEPCTLMVGRMIDKLVQQGLVMWRKPCQGWVLTAAGREVIKHGRSH